MTLRLAFMGTPEFAAPSLQGLIDAGHQFMCVYSQPPRRSGRGSQMHMSPIQALANRHGLMVRTPASFKEISDQDEFIRLEIDAAVVVAYGLRLPERILTAPKFGCLNAHASLLPRWRGAAPIERAILAGDDETGITVMQMNGGLDTGPMLLQERLPIGGDEDAGKTRERLSELAARMVARALTLIELGEVTLTEQQEIETSYARKLEVEEGRLDWHKHANELARVVRGFGPRPGAWFEHEGSRIKVLKAHVAFGSGVPGTVLDDTLTIACSDGALQLDRLQRPGKVAMDTAKFLRGYPLPQGIVL